MTRDDLIATYTTRKTRYLDQVGVRLEQHLKEVLKDQPRIDRVATRVKSIQSFAGKADNAKYRDPLEEIQDQIAARVIVFYKSDVTRISTIIERYYRPIEKRRRIPDSQSAFGYEGQHYIFILPTGVFYSEEEEEHCPDVFELQIKTLFQHAWGEANHDLAYKPGAGLTSDQERRVAFTAAQAWGADLIFDELFEELDPAADKQAPSSSKAAIV